MAERGRPRGFDREEALRRAMEVFWEHGYEGTSVSELGAAMGINAPSLYAAFGCKEALFREAVARYEECQGIELPSTGPIRDVMLGLLRNAAIAYTDPDTPKGCLVVLAATTYTPKSEGIRDHLVERRRAAAEGVRARLDRAVADGELAPGSNTELLASYLTTVMNGMSVQARDGAGRDRLLAIADAAMAGWDQLANG
jgi:AcrR family transcriptional regulator